MKTISNYIKTNVAINESSDKNHAETIEEQFSKMTPYEKRVETMKFMKTLYKKLPKDYSGVINDINLWNITGYPEWALKSVMKNNKRAEELLSPFIKHMKGLKNYKDQWIKESNELFYKMGVYAKKELISSLTDYPSIQEYFKTIDSSDFVRPFLFIDSGDVNMTDAEISKVIKKHISKFYNDFKFEAKRGSNTIEGSLKKYDQEYKKLQNAYNKMIKSNND